MANGDSPLMMCQWRILIDMQNVKTIVERNAWVQVLQHMRAKAASMKKKLLNLAKEIHTTNTTASTAYQWNISLQTIK